MTVAWVLYALAFGGLLAVAARGAESLLRAMNQPVRFVWGAAMALSLLVPVAAPWLNRAPLQPAHVTAVASLPVPTALAAPRTFFDEVAAAGALVVHAVSATVTAPLRQVITSAARVPRWLDHAVATLLLALAGGGLVLFGAVYLRLSRQRRHWPQFVLQGASVRVTPDVGPAVMGVAPSEIVVPQWLLARSAGEQQLVLAHEGEHVRAHDPWLLLLACSAVALMPWNALLWYMWSRLRLAVELDCDRRVLHGGATKPEYGLLLVALSGQRSVLASAMPAFSCSASHLEQRLLAMTALPARNQWARCIGAASVVALALLVACESKVPTAADIESMDVSKVRPELWSRGGTPLYTIDGKPATQQEASAIAAIRIESIVVRSPNPSNPVGAVNIMLRKTPLSGPAADSVNKLDGERVALRLHRADGNGIGGAPLVVGGDPLVFVNGVIVDPAVFSRFNTSNIESIEVIKGRAAVALSSDPRAINGIIRVTVRQ